MTQEEQSGGNSVVDKRVDFAYNAAGQYTSIARYNDVAGGSGAEIATSVFSYDTIGRLSDLAHQQGSTDLFTPYEWTYDGLSRITQIVSADGTSDYTYDETSQLTAADYDFQTDESYSYDANGNRTMTGYSTGDNNQLLSDGTYDYTYDEEGNRLTRTNTSTYESTEYTWDQRNRLIRVEDKDSMSQTVQVVEYIYDVFNRRIGRAVDTTSSFDMADAAIERYVLDDVNGVASLDGGNVVLDFVDPDGDGTDPIELSRRYLFGNAIDQLLAQENVTESTSAAARVHWPLTDHLGTVRDLVENDGTLGEHYTYTAYGQVASGDTSLTRLLFTSRELDEATGLQYNRARWYDSAVGRWVSEDPLGFLAGDTNISRFVRNSTESYVDPSGLVIVFLRPESITDATVLQKQQAQFMDIMRELAKEDNIGGALARAALSPVWKLHVRLEGSLIDENAYGSRLGTKKQGILVVPLTLVFPFSLIGKREMNLYDAMDGKRLFDDDFRPVSDEARAKLSKILIVHELGHALVGLQDPDGARKNGANVTLVENPYREAIGVTPRLTYKGFPLPGPPGTRPSKDHPVVTALDAGRVANFHQDFPLPTEVPGN